jgi:hypothetical protein
MQKWILEILAEKAYSAFHLYLDNTVSKVTVPCFEDVSDDERKAWMKVAEEVIMSYPQVEKLATEDTNREGEFAGDAS